MSKNKVPKCRDCEHFKKMNFSWTPIRNNSKMCKLKLRYMNYQEFKTSPKWCPRRSAP